jgi:hypothetical protein
LAWRPAPAALRPRWWATIEAGHDAPGRAATAEREDTMILQSTPVLFVDQIGRSRRFFEKLGFEATVQVPEGDGSDFIIMMQAGRTESGLGVMLQARSSAVADMTEVDESVFTGSSSFLFMSVADIDAASKALGDYHQFMPKRQTFYGATEVGFREPGGHYIVLAQFATESPESA